MIVTDPRILKFTEDALEDARRLALCRPSKYPALTAVTDYRKDVASPELIDTFIRLDLVEGFAELALAAALECLWSNLWMYATTYYSDQDEVDAIREAINR